MSPEEDGGKGRDMFLSSTRSKDTRDVTGVKSDLRLRTHVVHRS